MEKTTNVYLFCINTNSSKLDRLLRRTKLQTIKLNQIMANLSELTAKVEENKNVIESAILLIQNIKAALDAAKTDEVALKALSDALGEETTKLAEAVVANTL